MKISYCNSFITFMIVAVPLVSVAEANERRAFEHFHIVDDAPEDEDFQELWQKKQERDADEAIVEALHYFDMSMSMSMAPPTVAPSPSAPGSPTRSPSSATLPSVAPSPPAPGSPTRSPSSATLPSVPPSPPAPGSPTRSPTSATLPSVAPSPSAPGSPTRSPSSTTLPSVAPSPSAPGSPHPHPHPAPSSGSGPPSGTTLSPTPSIGTRAPSTPMQPSTSVPTATSPPKTPSKAPPGIPTTAPSPSTLASDFPSTAPTENSTVFVCTKDGIAIVENLNSPTTTIPITVIYVVETSASLDDIQDDLEAQILESAVIGALQCISGGDVFGSKGTGAEVPMFTSLIGDDCIADKSFCTVMKTEFLFVAGEDLNPDTAAFLGYIKLQDDMNSGVFVEEIPVLDRVTYRSPLPLLPPTSSPTSTPTEIDSSSSSTSTESLGLSPWTYGAVMATCVGGVMALAMWARNRRTRNQRHMQLLEDMSLGSGQDEPHLA